MHSASELLSIDHLPADGWLARLDARVKLLLALGAIFAAVASTRVWLPLGMAAGCFVLLAVSGASIRRSVRLLASPLGLAGVFCLLRALTTGHTPLMSLDVGPWHGTATREGLLDGTLIGARVLGSVSVTILLCAVTPAEGIFATLRWARLPRTWIEIAMLMYRYIFVLFEQASAVLAAQRIRLGYGTFRRSVCSMGSLAGQIALRSLDQAEKTHEAMTARGYQGTLPIPDPPALGGRNWRILGLGLSLVAAAFFLAERCLP